MIILESGHQFLNPDYLSQGYRLTRSVQGADPISADQFEAFGGAPEPKYGHEMPKWLAKQITSLRDQ